MKNVLILVLIVLVLSTILVAQKAGPKVFVSVDMEGI